MSKEKRILINDNQYCAKLNIDFPTFPHQLGPMHNFYGRETVSGLQGLMYYKLDESNDHLFEFIPKELRQHFYLTFMRINIQYVRPHTDSNIKVTINFYLDTNNCKTTFYSFNKDRVVEDRLSSQTNGRIYMMGDLLPEKSFIAKDNEVWILDVTKPHSVIALDSTIRDRTAFCLQSEIVSYEDTLSLLSSVG
jgi:hypothetical protein